MTEPPQPQAVLATITGKDLLDKLDTFGSAMQDLVRKIDPLPAVVNDHETRLRTVERDLPPDLGARVTALERARWKAQGGIALVSSLLASGIVAIVIEATRR